MSASNPTDGEVIVKLQGNTPIEDKLQAIIDNKVMAPAGVCRVVSPDVIVEAMETIRSLRTQLEDK